MSKKTVTKDTEDINKTVEKQMKMSGDGFKPDAVCKAMLEYLEAVEDLKRGVNGLKERVEKTMQKGIDELKKSNRDSIQIDGKTIAIKKISARVLLTTKNISQKEAS